MWFGIAILLLGIALFTGGIFVYNLAVEAEDGKNEWWEIFAKAGKTAGTIAGTVMFYVGIGAIITGPIILYFQDYR